MKRNCNQYFFNYASVKARNSYLPFVGSAADGYTFTQLKPFIFIGVAGFGGTAPNGTVGSVELTVATPSQQIAIMAGQQSLYQSIMSANISDTGFNQSGFLQYENAPSGREFWGYFSQYLNPDLMPENFYAFLQPALKMGLFWIAEDAKVESVPVAPSTQPVTIGDDHLTYERLLDTELNIFQLTDPRLWLPPGQYTILGDTAGNTDPYWTGLKQLGGSTGDSGFLILELKSIE